MSANQCFKKCDAPSNFNRQLKNRVIKYCDCTLTQIGKSLCVHDNMKIKEMISGKRIENNQKYAKLKKSIENLSILVLSVLDGGKPQTSLLKYFTFDAYTKVGHTLLLWNRKKEKKAVFVKNIIMQKISSVTIETLTVLSTGNCISLRIEKCALGFRVTQLCII